MWWRPAATGRPRDSLAPSRLISSASKHEPDVYALSMSPASTHAQILTDDAVTAGTTSTRPQNPLLYAQGSSRRTSARTKPPAQRELHGIALAN